MVTAILQARVNSRRLPGKVLKDISGRPLISFMIERLKRCSDLNKIILATTTHPSDDPLLALGNKLGINVVRGSYEDVLSRFILASEQTKDNTLVRLTGDCPLIDPSIISEVIKSFNEQKVDYMSNIKPPSFPDGLDVEVFTKDVLIKAQKNCTDKSEREHVTPWILNSSDCKIGNFCNSKDLSMMRWTVDEPEDLQLIREIVKHFNGLSNFTWLDVLKFSKNNPNLFKINAKFVRNEGSSMKEGQKLWRRAKHLIPGGNMLLSKRSEMFLPEQWPAYFSRAKGCLVWDLEGREFIDMSIMGIGTNILGYGHPEVDEAVQKTIISGNMSTLNCPEEVWLAERLIELHPWADMVRFARTGGEANSIAIRIARASSGKDTVAICGYHGWHDWYLATNIKNNSGLEEHLLPGLDPNGVPKVLSGTVKPFSFNRLDQLKEIASQNDLAAVKLEVQRSNPPEQGFLQGIRDLCNEKGIILIFDECTSGFRETFGGIHKKYSVNPDMAIFGKALGNGYAITSIIGTRLVMEAAQSTFISSTFWTERIGPTAALKTLEVMEKEKSWEIITQTGIYLRNQWENIAKKHGLNISFFGIPSLGGFTFDSPNALAYKTLISQEMLKRGYLASTLCYVSTSHTNQIIDNYLENLDEVFQLISDCESGKPPEELLEGPVCHSGFKRLN